MLERALDDHAVGDVLEGPLLREVDDDDVVGPVGIRGAEGADRHRLLAEHEEVRLGLERRRHEAGDAHRLAVELQHLPGEFQPENADLAVKLVEAEIRRRPCPDRREGGGEAEPEEGAAVDLQRAGAFHGRSPSGVVPARFAQANEARPDPGYDEASVLEHALDLGLAPGGEARPLGAGRKHEHGVIRVVVPAAAIRTGRDGGSGEQQHAAAAVVVPVVVVVVPVRGRGEVSPHPHRPAVEGSDPVRERVAEHADAREDLVEVEGRGFGHRLSSAKRGRPDPSGRACPMMGSVRSRRQRHRIDEHAVDVRVLHVATEVLGARPGGLQHLVVDRVGAGVDVGRDVAGAQHGARHVLVGLVGHVLAIRVLHRRHEDAVELRPEGLVVVGEVAEVHHQPLRDVHAVGEAVAVLVGVVGEAGMLVGADLLAHHVARLVVIHRAGDREAVRVVADEDDERVRVRLLELARDADRLVEGDHVVDRALPVEGVGRLVGPAVLDHQEEAVRVLRQHLEGRAGHVGDERLVGEVRHGARLRHADVEGRVEVAGVEEAEDLAARLVVGDGLLELGGAGGEGIALVLERRDHVLVVLALRARRRLRQEVGRAAAEEQVRLDGEVHLGDLGLVVARDGVGDERRGRRVLDLGVRDDAERLVGMAADRLAHGLDLRVVEVALRPAAVDAERVHHRLVAGHVGGHRVGAVVVDRVLARGADEGHVLHLFIMDII